MNPASLLDSADVGLFTMATRRAGTNVNITHKNNIAVKEDICLAMKAEYTIRHMR